MKIIPFNLMGLKKQELLNLMYWVRIGLLLNRGALESFGQAMGEAEEVKATPFNPPKGTFTVYSIAAELFDLHADYGQAVDSLPVTDKTIKKFRQITGALEAACIDWQECAVMAMERNGYTGLDQMKAVKATAAGAARDPWNEEF